jgi:hypothetical protein
MRILFDENFPADFAALLVGHEASNVHSHGWADNVLGIVKRDRAA